MNNEVSNWIGNIGQSEKGWPLMTSSLTRTEQVNLELKVAKKKGAWGRVRSGSKNRYHTGNKAETKLLVRRPKIINENDHFIRFNLTKENQSLRTTQSESEASSRRFLMILSNSLICLRCRFSRSIKDLSFRNFHITSGSNRKWKSFHTIWSEINKK